MRLGPTLVKENNLTNLSPSSLRQFEETMLQVQSKECEEPFRITARSAKGPFGSIIADYEKKLQSKLTSQKAAKGLTPISNVIDGKNLLRDGDESYHNGRYKHARDPRRGTSLINVDIDLKSEVPMTMKTFKKVFTKNLSNSAEMLRDCDSRAVEMHPKSPINEVAKQFLKWLEAEKLKDTRARNYISRDSTSKPNNEKPRNQHHTAGSLRKKPLDKILSDIEKPQHLLQSKWIKFIERDNINSDKCDGL